jgi:hypothetical protein
MIAACRDNDDGTNSGKHDGCNAGRHNPTNKNVTRNAEQKAGRRFVFTKPDTTRANIWRFMQEEKRAREGGGGGVE